MQISHISCSWCHTMNDTRNPFCAQCGHQVGAARMDCRCPQCCHAVSEPLIPVRPLAVGYYVPTAAFLNVKEHTAVMDAETRALIAVTGPAHDPASEAWAILFAHAAGPESAAPWPALAAARRAFRDQLKLQVETLDYALRAVEGTQPAATETMKLAFGRGVAGSATKLKLLRDGMQQTLDQAEAMVRADENPDDPSECPGTGDDSDPFAGD
jgi:hypothetical protein